MNFISVSDLPITDIMLDHHLSFARIATNENDENAMTFTTSFTFLVTDYVFLVSRSPLYSFFEKALLPFDQEVWHWLIGFLAAGLLVIVIVSFMSQKIRNFVFGLGIRAPMLNLV
jgi:hypothetical protein